MATRISIFLALICSPLPGLSQGDLKVTENTYLSVSEGTSLNVHELDLVNNGDIMAGTASIFINSDNRQLEIQGHPFQTGNLVINTLFGTAMHTSLQVENELVLRSGILDIGESNLFLGSSPGQITGEDGERRITGASGEIVKSIFINPNEQVNPGNMGLEISGSSVLGLTEIRRGHATQDLPGGSSISRYYQLDPEFSDAQNVQIHFNFFEAEQNGQDAQQIWKRNRSNWFSVPGESRSGTELLPLVWLSATDFELGLRYTVGPEENILEALADVPTAFTPNGDGLNDTFVIPWIQHFPNAVVTIFNQWGGKVYERSAYHLNAWDGQYNGEMLTSGSFYYVINFQGSRSPVNGKVSIIR